MSGKKDPEVTIDIGLGAKASLEAKVSTEIPAQSSGRLLDALTDIIRPFSERRGLKADQIRLQREEVLVEVARKARRRMEIENQPISPLPNKFLVPFLEKASLEELDSVLIDRWADLLASCSADPASAHPIFVHILSEMTGNDALLLHDIAFNSMDEVMHPNVAFCDCPDTYDPRYARRELEKWLKDNEKNIGVTHDEDDVPNVDVIYDHIIDMFGCPGVSLKDITVTETETNRYWSFNLRQRGLPPAAYQVDDKIEILCSLQVIAKHDIQISNGRFEVDIYYVCTTELGVEFLRKCDHELEQKLRAPPSC
jgi:hypothetical protein